MLLTSPQITAHPPHTSTKKIFGPIILLNLSSNSAAFTLSSSQHQPKCSPLHMSTNDHHNDVTKLPSRRESITTIVTTAIAFATTTATVTAPSYAREPSP